VFLLRDESCSTALWDGGTHWIAMTWATKRLAFEPLQDLLSGHE
jgi:hypothetical protein